MTRTAEKPIALVAALLLAAACTKSPRREPGAAATAELHAQPVESGAQTVRPCTYETGPLSAGTRAAIERALADERRAEAEYDALVRVHGAEPPLVNVVRSERRHAAELEQLLRMHGAPVPTSVAPEPRVTAADARAACAHGAESERENIALYDELLASPLPDDVRCVFERLRAMSATRHLPAFERCASRPPRGTATVERP